VEEGRLRMGDWERGEGRGDESGEGMRGVRRRKEGGMRRGRRQSAVFV